MILEEILHKKITGLIVRVSFMHSTAFLLSGWFLYAGRNYSILDYPFVYTPAMQAGTVLGIGLFLLVLLWRREVKEVRVLTALFQGGGDNKTEKKTADGEEKIPQQRKPKLLQKAEPEEEEYQDNGILVHSFQSIGEEKNTFYDIFSDGSGKKCILLGEIVGGSDENLLFQTALKAMVRIQAQNGKGLSQIMENINRQMGRESSDKEVRAQLVFWDCMTGCLRYCYCGDGLLLVKEKEGKPETVRQERGSTLSGDNDFACWEEYTYLKAGSRLLLCNGGITSITAQEEERAEEWLAETFLETEEEKAVCHIGTKLKELQERDGLKNDILLLYLQQKEE